MCCNKITLLSRSLVKVGGNCALRYQRALVGDVFERRTANGSKLFSCLTFLRDTTFILSSISPVVETVSLEIWKRPLSWHAKCSLKISVRGSKTLLALIKLFTNSTTRLLYRRCNRCEKKINLLCH